MTVVHGAGMEQNPYQPPASQVPAQLSALGPGNTLRLRILPREISDILVGVPAGLMPILAVLILGYWLSGSWLGAALVFAVWSMVFMAFQVRRVVVEERGLRLVRAIGHPAFIAWEDMPAPVIAPAREVMLLGWMWPPLLPREATTSLTCHGAVRIMDGAGRFAYLPVEDPEGVIALLEQRRTAACQVVPPG